MDFLLYGGIFAPSIFHYWILIAYMVAYVRVRKVIKNDQAIFLIIIPIFTINRYLWTGYALEESPSALWWLSYLLYLFLMPFVLEAFHGMWKQKTHIGYPHPIDVLFFKFPQWDMPNAASEPVQVPPRSYVSANLFIILLTISLAAMSYTSLGLRICGWLDTRLGQSNCIYAVATDTNSIKSIAVSPDGKLFALGGSDAVPTLYNLADGQRLRMLTEHTDRVSSLAFSPDGNMLASGSWDGSVRIWQVQDGTLLHVLRFPEKTLDADIKVAFSPDGSLIAAASSESNAQLWRVADGDLVHSFATIGNKISFSPDGSLMVLASRDAGLTLWQIAEQRALYTFGKKNDIENVFFAPDGQTLMTVSGYEQTIIDLMARKRWPTSANNDRPLRRPSRNLTIWKRYSV